MSITHTNTLYLVRHGENLANLTKEFSYKLVDYSLTPKGVLQAEQTAEFFKTVPLDAIYSSPLKRARETAEIIARPQGQPVTLLEAFRELNVGDLELMPPTEANWKLHDQVVNEWMKGNLEAAFPGGENFLEIIERARRGLLEVTRGRERQHILIAAHGGILTAIVNRYCLGANNRQKRTGAGMHNCAITEIELTTGSDVVAGTLRAWSSVTHLSGEAAKLVSPVLAYEKETGRLEAVAVSDVESEVGVTKKTEAHSIPIRR